MIRRCFLMSGLERMNSLAKLLKAVPLHSGALSSTQMALPGLRMATSRPGALVAHEDSWTDTGTDGQKDADQRQSRTGQWNTETEKEGERVKDSGKSGERVKGLRD